MGSFKKRPGWRNALFKVLASSPCQFQIFSPFFGIFETINRAILLEPQLVRLTFFFPKKKSPECPRTEDSDDLWYWGSLSSGTSCRCFETCFFSDARCSPWLSRPQIQNVFCILKAPFLLIDFVDFGCFSLVEMVKEIVHFFKNQSCWAVRFALAFNIQKSTSALFFWSCREWYNFLWAWLTIIGPPRICKTLDN